jgi:hypothetical protein
VRNVAPVSTTGDIAPWIICQTGSYRSSRLPLGSALGSRSFPFAGSPGYSTAHCGRARSEHFRPDVRRCGKDRLRFQFRQGDVAFRAHPRTPADIALILTRFNAVPVASGMVCSQALRTESGTRGRSSTLK